MYTKTRNYRPENNKLCVFQNAVPCSGLVMLYAVP